MRRNLVSLMFCMLVAGSAGVSHGRTQIEDTPGGKPIRPRVMAIPLKMIESKQDYCDYLNTAAVTATASGAGVGTTTQLTHYQFKVFHVQTATGVLAVDMNLLISHYKDYFPGGSLIPISMPQIWGQELNTFNVKFEGDGIAPVSFDFFKDGEIVYKERLRPAWMHIDKLGDLGKLGSFYGKTTVAFTANIPANVSKYQPAKAKMTITSQGASFYKAKWWHIRNSWVPFSCSTTVIAGAERQ